MKILVTGSSGYIGQKTVPRLDGEVKCLDRNGHSGPGRISADIREPNLDLSSFNIIYHLAGVSSPRMADKDQDAAWDINVNGTLNICRKLGKGQRLVFMSSAQVYDRSSKAVHTEQELPMPSNFYGLTKLVGEDTVRYYSLKNGFSYVLLRLFNAYSADQPKGLLIGDLMEKFARGNCSEIYNPDTVLDLVHVEDVVSVLSGAAEIPQGTYNLCSGKPVSIREVYESVARHLGKKCGGMKVASDKKESLAGDNSRLRSLGYKFRPFGL
jgi:UDP-glucose 4-epimerase